MYVIIGIVVLLAGSCLFLLLVTLRNRGFFKSRSREIDMAIVGFTQMIRKNPSDAQAHVKRGIARYKKHNVKGALEDLARALELDPTSTEAHYNCAVVAQETGNAQRALKEYEWIRRNSEDPLYKTAVADRLRKMKAIH